MTQTPGEQPSTAAQGATAAASPDSEEKEWWDNPGMPWKHEPSKADKQCFGWFMFMGLFGLVLLPFRGWLLGRDPALMVALMGSRSATAAMGALASQHLAPYWHFFLVLGTLMSIKFDWIYWWMGRLWGRGMIEVWAGQSKRAKRNYDRVERWADKMGWLGMFVAYVPIPLPLMQVIFVLAGTSRMGWKKFGRRQCPSPKMRSSTGTPFRFISRKALRAISFCRFISVLKPASSMATPRSAAA